MDMKMSVLIAALAVAVFAPAPAAASVSCSYVCTWGSYINSACLSQCNACVALYYNSGCSVYFNPNFNWSNGYYYGASCGQNCPLWWWQWLLISLGILFFCAGCGLCVFFLVRRRRG